MTRELIFELSFPSPTQRDFIRQITDLGLLIYYADKISGIGVFYIDLKYV